MLKFRNNLKLSRNCSRFIITVKSLFYNCFLNWSYICDIFLEPIISSVENFTTYLGPIFVGTVSVLTAFIVYIAYYIGIPYWWGKNPALTVVLFIVGNWLLVNVCFHYYMGVTVSAGYPPRGGLIPEAVSICKKCIKPKPPRTHHCSICNRCILKMDHHCPWMNNCIGHYNHRYFFLYMVYMMIGIVFLITFSLEIFYEEFFLMEPEPEGHSVLINSNLEIIIVTESFEHMTPEERKEAAEKAAAEEAADFKRKLLLFGGVMSLGTLIALGALIWWHAGLITRGETSIEGRINSTISKKFKIQGKTYHNPYNFGPKENWMIFLGIQTRSWWSVLFPSTHAPTGNGLTWKTVKSETFSKNHCCT